MAISRRSVSGNAALGVVISGLLGVLLPAASLAAWEPDRVVELVVPAGTGSGLDQMARLTQGIIVKYNLMKQPLVVQNKAGGANRDGSEGFVWLKNGKGDPYRLLIAGNNLFTTPLGAGAPVGWRDMSPVAMVAFEPFILWTNVEKAYKSAKEYIDSAKAAGAGQMKIGGQGTKQEAQVLVVSIEQATGARFAYLPFKGGGEFPVALVGARWPDSFVNKPINAVAMWRGGSLVPQCVFDAQRLPSTTMVTQTHSWNDIPTCKEAGIDVVYQSPRSFFMAPGVSSDQMEYFIDVLKKVTETPEWKDYMGKGAYTQTLMTGQALTDWLVMAESFHRARMAKLP